MCVCVSVGLGHQQAAVRRGHDVVTILGGQLRRKHAQVCWVSRAWPRKYCQGGAAAMVSGCAWAEQLSSAGWV